MTNPRKTNVIARFMLKGIRFYQRSLSNKKPAPTCRFTPTCSNYAVEAIKRHGALKGGWLSIWRILRCNPFVPCGHDPVPKEFPRKRHAHK